MLSALRWRASVALLPTRQSHQMTLSYLCQQGKKGVQGMRSGSNRQLHAAQPTSPPSSNTNTSPCSKGDMVPASIFRYGSTMEKLKRETLLLCPGARTRLLLLTNFDGCHPEPTVLQKHANAACSNAFSQPTDYTTSNQYVLHRAVAVLLRLLLLSLRQAEVAGVPDGDRPHQRFACGMEHCCERKPFDSLRRP